jgi:transcription elongation factor Elf1
MKLIEVTSQHRRDFWGTYKCEFCNHTEKNVSGYDDYNFHANVTPQMNCKECGESTLSKGGSVQQVQTKYPEHYQI